MKTLILLRHAKSSWDNPDIEDFERPLNQRGLKDAPLIAEFLTEIPFIPELIVSSPAKRAKTTAEIISEKTGYNPNNIVFNESVYEADADILMEVVNSTPDKVNTLLLVGHNPAITVFCNLISDKRIDNIPTCGLAAIQMNIKSWKSVAIDCGKLIFFEYPKKAGF